MNMIRTLTTDEIDFSGRSRLQPSQHPYQP